MKIVTADQHSVEWLQARLGKVTASSVALVDSFYARGAKKGGETKERHRYKRQLALERLTGVFTPHYVSPDMDFGSQYESAARAAYVAETDYDVQRVGFVEHPAIAMSGASPDGIIQSKRGCVEFKIPRLDNHLDWLEADEVPEEHLPQCRWVTECCEYDWCDFVSYSPPVDDEDAHPSVRDPRRVVLPKDMQIFIKRLHREDAIIQAMRDTVHTFLGEVDELVAKLRAPRRTLNDDLRESLQESPCTPLT